MNRVDRLMAYLVIFQSRGLLRAKDLAAHFEISERTVYRDIDALSQVGVPIYGIAGEGFRLMEGYYLPPITFSSKEARALALALSMFIGFSQDGETRMSAEAARDKIRSVLPEPQKQEVEILQNILSFFTFPNPQIDFDDQRFLTIQQAIRNQLLLDLTYHSFTGNTQTQRVVEPINLTMLNHTWQLTAYCRLRQGVRNFNLDRIAEFQVLTQTFSPRQIPFRRFPKEQFDVRVLFHHDVVRWVRERQHFSFVGEEEDLPDGVIMVYRIADWKVIEAWLLGWGAGSEIIAPRHLREKVAETARRMVANHSD